MCFLVFKKIQKHFHNRNKTLKKIQLYKQLLSLISSQKFSDLVHFAIDSFQIFFEFSINDILGKFPSDFLNEKGEKFWKGSKRQPLNIRFNYNDEKHLNFIFSLVMILSKIVGINFNENNENILKNIKNIAQEHILKIYDYTKNNKEKSEEIISKEINVFLCDFNNLKLNKKFNEISFDFSKNFHVDFIMNCANLRAENFKLDQIDFLKAKMCAGNIINTNYSVTTILSGLITQNILTLSNFDNLNEIDVSYLKNCFFNVGVNIFLMVDVFDKKIHKNYCYNNNNDDDDDNNNKIYVKAIPEGWKSWDVINIEKENLSVKEFIEYFKEKFGCIVTKIINKNSKFIDKFNQEILNEKIETLLKNDEIKNDDDDDDDDNDNNNKKDECDNDIYLEINGLTENNEEIEMPLFKYHYK